jgi:hypothetical protein
MHVEDLETQKKGMVIVMWGLGPSERVEPLSFQHTMKQVKNFEALPMRVAALHFCYDHWYIIPVLATLKVGFDVFTRLRIRSHYGEYLLVCMHAVNESIVCFYVCNKVVSFSNSSLLLFVSYNIYIYT